MNDPTVADIVSALRYYDDRIHSMIDTLERIEEDSDRESEVAADIEQLLHERLVWRAAFDDARMKLSPTSPPKATPTTAADLLAAKAKLIEKAQR